MRKPHSNLKMMLLWAFIGLVFLAALLGSAKISATAEGIGQGCNPAVQNNDARTEPTGSWANNINEPRTAR